MLRGANRFLLAVIIVAVLPSFCFGKRTKTKVFPAKHDSVLIENQHADALGYERFATLRDLHRAVEAGELVPLTTAVDRRLPRDRRYARPQTVLFVENLDREFYEATGGHLVVDSAVRSTDVQQRLRRRNRNAAPAIGASASSHERGTTVDLSRRMSRERYRWLLVRLLYYEGRGQILIIEERGCLHIFVGKETPDEQRDDIGLVEIPDES